MYTARNRALAIVAICSLILTPNLHADHLPPFWATLTLHFRIMRYMYARAYKARKIY